MKQHFRLKVIVDGKMMTDTLTHSKRRFFRKLGTINWEKRPSVYIRVTYDQSLDVSGKRRLFYNDGTYTDKTDLLRAATAFTEP